jgi:two-component system chemotaxis sensor kinase CheA
MEMNEAFLKKLIAAFTVEARDHVEEIGEGLRALQSGDDASCATWLETIFRGMHSLKGAARAVNRRNIEMVCQAAEGLFSILHKKNQRPSEEGIELLFAVLDLIEGDLDHPDATDQESVEALAFALTELAQNPDISDLAVPVIKRVTAPEKEIKPEVVLQKERAPVTASAPAAAKSETLRVSQDRLETIMRESEELLAFKLSAEHQVGELRKIAQEISDWKNAWREINPILRRLTQQTLSEKEVVEQTGDLRHRLEDIREKLDPLELTVSSVCQMAQTNAVGVARFSNSLTGHMRGLLMMPFSSSLTLLHKVVRDLSGEQGKQIDFTISGGEAEADRRILEGMKDPLMHLIRNSIDHGIEPAAERAKKGKPAQGMVSVSIDQVDSGKVEIRIEDDGCGLDLQKIREMLVSRDLATKEDVRSMSDAQVASSIFLAGFSTAKKVTEISGRGIGMSVVRERVESFNGSVSVFPRQPFGTVFSIVLPVSVATFRGILVTSGGKQLIVPTPAVEQMIRIPLEEIKTVGNRNTIALAGRVLPLESLAGLLELPQVEILPDRTHVQALVICAGNRRLALEVDDVIREQEVLVKGLGPQLVRVSNISGVAVLGTGELCPILNLHDLIKSSVRGGARPLIQAVEPTETSKKSIMIAEDSITSRMLLKNVLESAGYKVGVAVNGATALAELKTNHYDALVSDVDMPRMNGFVLTERVRADRKLAELPVVLVTSLSSDDDKERGINAGASAYIVKSSFDQSNLLAVLDRLLETV